MEEISEFNQAATKEQVEDAIGDIMIYLADYCERNGLTLTSENDGEMYFLSTVIGKLCHYHLKMEQGIRHTPEECKAAKQLHVGNLVRWVQTFRSGNEWFWEVINKTWDQVKQRDWQAKPKDGVSQ